MQQERRAANRCAVHPSRRDAKGMRDLHRSGETDRRDAIDVPGGQAGVGERVQRGFEVQLQRGLAGQLPDLIGLGRPRDDDPAHAVGPAGAKSGRLTAPRRSNVTCNGMSSTRSSGVFGTPVRFAIIRGPSASWTTAIAYGASSSNPGAGLWLITYEYSVAAPLAVNHSTSAEPHCGQTGRG